MVCNLQRFFASLPFWLRTSEHAWDYIGSYNSCEQFLPDNPVFIILQAAFSQQRILTRYKTIIISYFLTLELDILIGYITLFNYTDYYPRNFCSFFDLYFLSSNRLNLIQKSFNLNTTRINGGFFFFLQKEFEVFAHC